MSGITDTATVVLTVNGAQAKQVMAEIETKAKTTAAAIEKMKAAGADPKDIQKAQRELRGYNRQLDEMRSSTEGVTRAMANLDKATPRQLEKSIRALNRQLKGMTPGTQVWKSHVENIQKLQAQLKLLKEQIKGQESIWQRFSKWWYQSGQAVAAVVAGYKTVVNSLRSYVDAYAQMDEEMANTCKFTGMTEEQVASLNEEFKKMDTRTSREQLNQLGQEAGRLGKSSTEDVMEFVKAADIINVALDELGEGATLEISKITDIFNIEDQYGTYQSMLKTSSVVNDLSQSCTASAPYIVEFTKRLAGVGSQANMTVPEIMAIGATLDAMGMNVEMSATAISQSVMKLFQKPKEIAQALGMDVNAFVETLKNDTTQGLLMFLDAVNKVGGDENGEGMMALAPLFEELQLDGARMSQVLGGSASKVDDLRKRIDEANKSFEDGTSTLNEYTIFNNTAQASIDKAKKIAHEFSIELGKRLCPVMEHFISTTSAGTKAILIVMDFIAEYKTEIITLVSTIALYKAALMAHNAIVNVAALKTAIVTKATAAWHIVTGKLSGVISIGRVAIAAMTNAIQYLTNGLNVNHSMQQRWRKAMAGMSFASWTGLILGLASAVFLLYRRMKRLDEERRVVEKIRDEAIKKVGEERVSIDLLVAAAKNEALSLDERKKAINKLNAIIPNYNAQLDKTSGKYKANKTALDEYLKSLTKKYELEGAKSKLAELGREKAEARTNLADAQKQYERIKSARGRGQGISYTTSWGAVGNTAFDSTGHAKSILDKAEWKMKEVEAKEQKILDAFGVDLHKDAANNSTTTESTTSEDNDGDGDFGDGGDLGNPRTGKPDRFQKEDDWRERYLAKNRIAYATGEKDYQNYMETIDAIELEYLSRKLEHQDLTDAEQLQLQADYYERYLKTQDTFLNGTKEDEEKRHADAVEALKQRFINEELTTEQYNNAMRLLELEHYRNLSDIADRGSKEVVGKHMASMFKGNVDLLNRPKVSTKSLKEKGWNDAGEGTATVFSSQYGINDASGKKREILVTPILPDGSVLSEEELENYINETLDGASDILQADSKGIVISVDVSEDGNAGDVLHRLQEMYYNHNESKNEQDDRLAANKRYQDALFEDAERHRKATEDAEQEHQRRMDKIKDEYFGDNLAERQSKYDADFAILQQVYAKEIQAAGNNADEKLRIEENFLQAQAALRRMYGLESEKDTKNTLQRAVADSVEWLNSDGGKAVTGTIDTLMSGMSSIFSGISSIVQAELDIETAAIEKRYESEVNAAQGNTYKLAKLEKKKEADIAKAKNAANKKMFAMQVIQAVAQTAQNALSAYGSAAAVPVVGYVLAPIAAAMAVAAGAIQIAAIKKQQQASEAQGYAEGGFTKQGPKYEPAGIVHAGEWVASQKLLANPVARPLIEALDYAQRTNTFGSLRGEDVSRSITAPVALTRIADGDASSGLVVAAVTHNAEAVQELTRRLNEPFVTHNTVTGDYGIKKAQDEYAQLMRNVTPKSKRR